MSDFLVDAGLPRATGDLIRRHGHQATDVRDIGLGTASDQDIADHARQHQLAIVSVTIIATARLPEEKVGRAFRLTQVAQYPLRSAMEVSLERLTYTSVAKPSPRPTRP